MNKTDFMTYEEKVKAGKLISTVTIGRIDTYNRVEEQSEFVFEVGSVRDIRDYIRCKIHSGYNSYYRHYYYKYGKNKVKLVRSCRFGFFVAFGNIL